MTAPSLEKRVAAALTDNISSRDLAELIAETEAAIFQADTAAKKARERALDPTVIDPAARTAMQDAEFLSQRLRAALPRLQERLAEVEAAEYAALWEANFEKVEARRDELAREYAATYPKIVAEVVGLLQRAEAIDKEVARINGSAPYGERRRLVGVECAARGLERFTNSDPSIAQAVQLPDFERSARMVWPPPVPPIFPVIVTPVHPGADWQAAHEARNAARREEGAHVAAHYNAMAKQREEREAAEEEQQRQIERRRQAAQPR